MERRQFISTCGCAAAAASLRGTATVASAGASPPDDGVLLEGVDRYRVVEPLFEGVRVVLAHRGEPYSPAYVQGLSGAAFRIAGICPCAPTCGQAMSPAELLQLLGYQIEHVSLAEEGLDLPAATEPLVARIRADVRAGRAVLVWHAFTNAEWDVVCGYDARTAEFMGRGSYAGLDVYARADETRLIQCIDICPPQGAIFVGERIASFERESSELASLREAVAHAHSQLNVDKLSGKEWAFLAGLRCYDRWVRDYASDARRKRSVGDSYCLGVYRSTHRAASVYLQELASRYLPAESQLERAAVLFSTEADLLDRCWDELGWHTPEGPDVERNARAAHLLGRARDAYSQAIETLEKALAALG